MTTVVFLHAHPDDESTATAGTMARAAEEGDRVVVIYATNGDHGTVPVDLTDEVTLVDHRRAEAEASARILGTARVHWLGYADSGMTGWEQNAHEQAFANADVDEAARLVASVLDEEGAGVLVGYDWHGGYGHPDHVQVHRVARRAAELAAVPPLLLESTINRDYLRTLNQRAAEFGMTGFLAVDDPADDGNPIGEPESQIHHRVDVRDQLARKRAAVEAHGSQADVQMILGMPEPAFQVAFAYEHYIEPGRSPGIQDCDLPWRPRAPHAPGCG